MDYFLLKTLHVAAAFGVFCALGAICLGGSGSHRKTAVRLHAASLVVMLLVGLHLLFDRGLVGTGGWWHIKVLLWLALGVAPVLARRKLMPPAALLGICLVLGAAAAFLGVAKPF